MDKLTFTSVGVEQMIKSHTVYSWWQKYINGINLTYYDCWDRLSNCTLPRKENTFYVVTHMDDRDFIEDEDDDNVAYHSSLIVPILIEIGKVVNYSLYVSREREHEIGYFELLHAGKIDSIDRVPQLYDYETDTEDKKLICSKPLYISNQLSILSAIVKKEMPATLDLWKTFDIKVWTFILTAFMLVIIADKLLAKNQNRKRFYHIIWVYFKPILGIGEHIGYHNFIYVIWVLSVIPLTEIFKNELLASLIAVPDLYADNIDDLLEDRLTVYTDNYKLGSWNTNLFKNSVEDNEFRKKFEKLLNKTKELNLKSKYWLKLLENPKELRTVVKKSALLEDDQSIVFFKEFVSRFIDLHSAEEAYVPKLITPLCYGLEFKFPKEAEEISLLLFERSLFDYWTKVKVRFYIKVGLKLFESFFGEDTLDKFYDDDEKEESLDLDHTRSLFLWLLYCFVLHIVVLCIEILHFKFKN